MIDYVGLREVLPLWKYKLSVYFHRVKMYI